MGIPIDLSALKPVVVGTTKVPVADGSGAAQHHTISQLATFIGGGGATNVYGETPAGAVNDINVTFTLANTPTAGTERLLINGLRQKLTDDYTIITDTITFVLAPTTGAVLLADYTY